MRAFSLAAVTYGLAAVVSAVCATIGAASNLQHGAEVVAMLALATCVSWARSTVPRLLRLLLLTFCLLLAARASVELIASQISMPVLPPERPNGCPAETEATTAYWRGQLRYGQFAEVIRSAGLACAIQVVRRMPHSTPRGLRGKYAATALLLIVPLLYALFPFSSSSDAISLVKVAVPGIASLALAVALTVVSVARAGTRSTNDALLTVGALSVALPAVFAVESLAEIHRQLPDPAQASTSSLCLSVVATAANPPMLWIISVITSSLVLMAAPAVLAWSVLSSDFPARNDAGRRARPR